MCIRDSTRAAEVQNNQDNHHHLPLFESIDEVEYAIAARKIGYHDWIRLHNPDSVSYTHLDVYKRQPPT